MNPSRRPRLRTCPRCERRTGAWNCCGIDLTVRRRPWLMTPDKIRLVHVLAHRKGLDEEIYRARLALHGVDSCVKLDRKGFHEFVRGLAALPDRPDYARRSSARSTRRARG